MRWLMLRGLAREARHWGEFPSQFAQGVGTPPPLALDLPGVGTESGREAPLSIPGYTDDLRSRYFASGGGDGPWGLLAISLGGMIALDWMARFPWDFERAVVINTSAGDASQVWERLSWRQYLTVARCFRASPLEREQMIASMISNRSARDLGSVPERWAGYALERPVPPEVIFRQLAAAARSKLPARIERPVLMLASDNDRLVSSRCSERIAERLGLEIRYHPWAGHDLPLDDPEWVVAKVKGWLQSRAPLRATG
jgi:pimeloyl-ACP methyl ester carboxylesterase